ncbi:K02A2.6-like, partial [Cordylochernes scorpioides]
MPGYRKRRQFKQTDAFTRGLVIGLKRAGWSIRQIAADTHLGASTVHRLWRRWLEQGNVAIYRNVGATRVTSARVDRRILRQAVAAPQATCTAILQHVQDTLDHSISTRMECRPLRRLPLTPPNRRQRLEWFRARSTWITEWHRVVFSEESRFCLSSDSRRVRVWRRRGERYNLAAIVERPTVRQRGIMVWGAIAYDSRSPLLRIQGTMTAQRYVDDVLRPVTLPYLQGVPNALYQQDNARPHTARISQQALQDVQMLPWPPYSPDLSPIEHVWDIIGRRLHALPQPRSEDELWQMVEREWRAIPQDAIRTLTLYLDVLLRASPSTVVLLATKPTPQHLEPKKKIIPQRCLFLKRTQRENETVSEYLRELKHLASNCAFGEMLEMMLRDRFVAGLTSESLQKRLLQKDDEVKLERVFALAVSYELAEKDAKELHEREVARVTSHIERSRNSKGREWLKFLNKNYSKLLNVNKISESCIDSLIKRYANLFKDELGCLKDVKLDISIKKKEAPVFCKARSLPYSLKKKVEDELECMVERGILEPLVHASWAAPIVPVVKKDGSIRICGDFRSTANKAIILDKYPLPTIDEIFSRLSGSTIFSTLDLSMAYLQVELTDEAKRVVNINTTKGLFAYRRLPYGVAVAPNKFQRLMDNVFADIPGVACYIDDILVSGKDARDHKSKLELVFKKLEEKGLKLNKAKCKFAVDSVEYLGF